MKTRNLTLAALLMIPVSLYAQDRNTTQGTNAGAGITSGDDNTMVGYDAGRTVDVDSQNVIIGSQAAIGSLDTTVSDYLDSGAVLLNDFGESQAVVIGYRAAWQSVDSFDSVYIGYYAGSEATGDENTYVGNEAGRYTTTGDDNVFIGDEAGRNNTTGYESIYIGDDSGEFADTGFRNVGVGNEAIHSGAADGGFLNTAVGNEAGWRLNDGWKNTLLGGFAGEDIIDGFLNTMIGANAGNHSQYPDYNTFVGAYSGNENGRTNDRNNANNNTYVGALSMPTNREGQNNVVVGAFSDSSNFQNEDLYHPDFIDALDGISAVDSGAGSLGVGGDTAVDRSTLLGSFIWGSGNDTVAVGYGGTANGHRSINIGATSVSTHNDAIVIGYGAASHGNNIAVIGNATTASIDPGADGVTALGSPAYRYSSAASENYVAIGDATSPAYVEFRADAGTQSDDEWRIEAADSGDLTIETRASGIYTPVMTISNNGNVVITGEMSVNSDARLKTEIKDIDNGLQLITQLNPKTYRWKPYLERGTGLHYGLLAHEVEEVIPDLVSADEDGIKSVNYQELIPLLIGAVQRMTQENAVQQGKIDKLQSEAKIKRETISDIAELKLLVAENKERIGRLDGIDFERLMEETNND